MDAPAPHAPTLRWAAALSVLAHVTAVAVAVAFLQGRPSGVPPALPVAALGVRLVDAPGATPAHASVDARVDESLPARAAGNAAGRVEEAQADRATARAQAAIADEAAQRAAWNASHAADYWPEVDVDTPATPLAFADLIYPAAAFMERIPGRVRARIYINAQGAIDHIDILAADPGLGFEQAAIRSLVETRFRPALRLGAPVKSSKLVEVVFDPDEDRPDATRLAARPVDAADARAMGH